MKYLSWCKREYIREGHLLDAMIESIQYGTGEEAKAASDPIVYSDSQYIITQDTNGYCYLFAR